MKNIIRFIKSAWYSFVGILAKKLIDEAYKDGWHEGFDAGCAACGDDDE